jgi:hypothetical protein
MYSHDPLLDEFAHTRPPDDLFDDDFVPVDPETNFPEPSPVIEHPNPEPSTEIPPQESKAPLNAPRGPRRTTSSQTKPTPPSSSVPAPSEGEKASEGKEPRRDTAAAVRGDRSGTGGVRKAKLTEEELSAKLEAMKIKNAALVAAHEASVADAESFEAREAIAATRRREEGVKRRELMGEREKNRIRKLKAQGVREWDVGKEERESEEKGLRRGMHGGVVGERAPRDQPRMEDDGQSNRGGRRDFRGGGRGRGRGGHHGGPPQSQVPQSKDVARTQAIPKAEDFPELPMATSGAKEESKGPVKLDFPLKKDTKTAGLEPISLEPSKDKRSWADQVESP